MSKKSDELDDGMTGSPWYSLPSSAAMKRMSRDQAGILAMLRCGDEMILFVMNVSLGSLASIQQGTARILVSM